MTTPDARRTAGDGEGNDASAAATAPRHDASLVELLDRVLERGVVLHGDIQISVADVALVRLSVSLLLAAEDTARDAQRSDAGGPW